MRLIRVIGMIGGLGSGILILVSVTVGLAYNRDLAAQYAAFAVGGSCIIGLSLYLMLRRREGVVLSILALGLGIILIAGGGYYLLRDPGDAALYAGPVLLGVALIVTEFETKGDAR